MEEALLAWYAENGRDLPWRRTRDPYAILVSEIMLQQTQVDRVLPRYVAWIERWPDVESLASEVRANVIEQWQGLGYNRRAVYLHEASRRIAALGWPEDLTELPGVGRYTADAIARFAHGEWILPVDTNVRRVLKRAGDQFSPASAQALMDLGATVCLARVPRCSSCPLAAECPSAGSRYPAERRQGPFEGSFRQRRADVLRAVTRAPGSCKTEGLDDEAVAALVRDGLVVISGNRAGLPEGREQALDH